MTGKTNGLNERPSPKSLSTEELDNILAESLEFDDSQVDFNYLYTVAEEYSTREGSPQLSPERAQELYKERLEPLMQTKRKVSKTRILRTSLVAAVLAVILTGTALAVGTDFFNVLFRWDNEHLSFNISPRGNVSASIEDSQRHVEVPEELKPLQETMEEYGIPASLLPTYFPEGYEPLNLEVWGDENGGIMGVDFQKGNETISIGFNWFPLDVDNVVGGYEKDPGDPIIYEVNGTTYRIMTNMGDYFAMWTCGNIMCDIYVGKDPEILYKLLDSIP